jgi:hypothetical protein
MTTRLIRSPSVPFMAGTLAVLVAGVAGWVTHAGNVRVPFDSYYYIEFAKEFRTALPGSFGVAWPFGWPLLGAATALLGLAAYPGLVWLAATAWAGAIALIARLWPWNETGPLLGTLLLVACATTPAALQFTANVFSEVPFAFLLLAFALSLTRWPEPRGVLLSCGLALLALSVRYIGAVCFLLLGWQLLRTHRCGARWNYACVAIAAAGAGALLLWNRLATGYWSGYPRGSSEPFGAWLGIASDLGWSLPTLVCGLRGRDLLGFGSPAGPALGLLALAGLLALGGHGLRREKPLPVALGMVLLAYALAMIGLRVVGQFDPLHNARTGLPMLAPALLLAAPWFRPRLFLAVPLAWLALNTAFLLRGPNLAASADVAAVLPALRTLGPAEYVSANDEARTLSALLAQRVHRIETATPSRPVNYGSAIVLAAAPDGPQAGELPARWREFAEQLIRSGDYRVGFHSSALLLLQRNAPGGN